ncbi:MAG: YicC family protein [Ruminococcaceae bacterium]|nr:YicC family protein [Oscillospiraceae bacterium]
MIKSMTGYGSGKAEAGTKTFTVEIKSVNSRYSDFSIKMPRIYTFMEDAIRKTASARINRGKVDIYVNVETNGEDDSVVKVNAALAREYLAGLRTLSEELEVSSNATAETFLRIPDVFTVDKADVDEEVISNAILSALSEALDGFDTMRIAEGEKLVADLKEHLSFIANATAEVEKRSPQIVTEYRQRIEERMRDILGSATYDETRLLTEVAIFSDKVNVNEETVRLRSHVDQFTKMLDEGGSVGRKIDFLIQEMNREINTIGSKSNDLDVARIVIDVKAEIEKLREQIQNVE